MPNYNGTTHAAAARGNNDLARFLEGMDAEFKRKIAALSSKGASASTVTTQERTVIVESIDATAEHSSNKGVANGYCPLDENKLVPLANLPNVRARATDDFSKTTDTVLANVTGLTANVLAGKSYIFSATLFVDADGAGGHKYAIGGDCTATSIIYQVSAISNSANLFVINSRQTALGGSVGQVGATGVYAEIMGTITVNVSGTLTVQFAQNVASGTSKVLAGSSFVVESVS